MSASLANVKAAVVYSSRFGTTAKIAEALGSGLGDSGIHAACLSTAEARAEDLNQYDLICIGAPTEAFSASKPMKEYLVLLGEMDLKGKYFFAFDTRIDWRLSGSAAKYIEHFFEGRGAKKLAPRDSAIVTSQREAGNFSGATLKAGEEDRFRALGARLGDALKKTVANPVPPRPVQLADA